MSRASFLRRLFGSARRPESKPVRRSRLAVEALEDRAVPAVLTVNSTADNTTAGDGFVTLREAILAANSAIDVTTDLREISSGSGADTIKFSVTGTIELSDKLPELNGDLTITGPGANLLTVSGAKSYRLFTIINS